MLLAGSAPTRSDVPTTCPLMFGVSGTCSRNELPHLKASKAAHQANSRHKIKGHISRPTGSPSSRNECSSLNRFPTDGIGVGVADLGISRPLCRRSSISSYFTTLARLGAPCAVRRLVSGFPERDGKHASSSSRRGRSSNPETPDLTGRARVCRGRPTAASCVVLLPWL